MSKPIEKGCRAVIINSAAGNNGIVVIVGNRIDKPQGFDLLNRYGDFWTINKVIRTNRGNHCEFIGENQLKRIDDDNEGLTTWQSIEQLTKWNPEKVNA